MPQQSHVESVPRLDHRVTVLITVEIAARVLDLIRPLGGPIGELLLVLVLVFTKSSSLPFFGFFS
jgi:hypothetical protein